MKIDRLLGILTTLLRHQRVTTPYLAKKFEVSARTIRRDIDALCQAGIPVVTLRGTGGGVAIAEGYKLDKNVLTREELASIVVSLKGLGSVMEKTEIGRTLEKLSISQTDAYVSLRDSMVIDLSSVYGSSLTEKIEAIKRAIRETKIISFEYYYEKGDSFRRIEPYFIAFQWSAWYVFGFCLDRQDFRLFKLSRLWELSITGESYTPRTIPPEKRHFSSHITDHLTVIALFDPSEKYQLIDFYGPTCYTVTEDCLLRAELRYTNRSFIIRWLLGFGDKARVLYPPEIADEIKETAKNIANQYE
ncbi:MAG: YafY family transcriptional regulator [Firmicutes bacterium]|nr:YafY family transcriptional regulator [Bacillota bacterium]